MDKTIKPMIFDLNDMKEKAENGDKLACYILGRSYDSEENGAEQSFEKAMEWYLIGASCEDSLGVDAMRGVAHLYEEGKGVEQNQELADEWYEKAANAPEHVPANAKNTK